LKIEEMKNPIIRWFYSMTAGLVISIFLIFWGLLYFLIGDDIKYFNKLGYYSNLGTLENPNTHLDLGKRSPIVRILMFLIGYFGSTILWYCGVILNFFFLFSLANKVHNTIPLLFFPIGLEILLAGDSEKSFKINES